LQERRRRQRRRRADEGNADGFFCTAGRRYKGQKEKEKRGEQSLWEKKNDVDGKARLLQKKGKSARIGRGEGEGRKTHGDDGGLLAAGVLDELGEAQRNVDEGLEPLLRVRLVLLLILRVLLNIQPDRRALRTGSGESDNEARAVGEGNVETLVLRDGVVDRVGVGEVSGLGDGEGTESGVDEGGGGEGGLELLDHLRGGFRVDFLVIVAVGGVVLAEVSKERREGSAPREEGAAVFAVVVLKNAVDTLDADLVRLGEDVEPGCTSEG